MAKSLHIFLFLLLTIGSMSAQRHKRFTYLGLELGSKSGIFKVEDAGNELYSKNNLQNSHRGIFLEQEIDYIWSVGTGIYFSKQKIDFRFERDGAYNSYEAMRLIHIPIQAKAAIPLTYGTPEVRLTPVFGAHAVFNLSNNTENVRGRIPPDLSDTYSGTIRRDMKSMYFLVEGGINLDMMFAQGLIMSFGGSYFKGFSDVLQANLTYNIAKVPYRGSISTKGDNINVRLALKYPVSRFWKKSKGKKVRK
jgi:hypothetical protein